MRASHDHSSAPPWLKVLAWLGVLTAIVGMTVIGLDVVCDSAPRPDLASVGVQGFPGRDPFPGAPIPADDRLGGSTATGGRPARSGDAGLGIGLLSTGFTLAAVAGLGHAQRRRHQVTGSDATP